LKENDENRNLEIVVERIKMVANGLDFRTFAGLACQYVKGSTLFDIGPQNPVIFDTSPFLPVGINQYFVFRGDHQMIIESLGRFEAEGTVALNVFGVKVMDIDSRYGIRLSSVKIEGT
jgi:hypothetical protein